MSKRKNIESFMRVLEYTVKRGLWGMVAKVLRRMLQILEEGEHKKGE